MWRKGTEPESEMMLLVRFDNKNIDFETNLNREAQLW